MLKQQYLNAAVGGTTHTSRPETIKIDTFKYREVNQDPLLLWYVGLVDAMRASRIVGNEIE